MSLLECLMSLTDVNLLNVLSAYAASEIGANLSIHGFWGVNWPHDVARTRGGRSRGSVVRSG